MPVAFAVLSLLLVQEPPSAPEPPAGPRTVALPEDPAALALACGMVTNEHWAQMMMAMQDNDGDLSANAIQAASDSWLGRAYQATEAEAADAVAYAEHLDPEIRRIQVRWCVNRLWN